MWRYYHREHNNDDDDSKPWLVNIGLIDYQDNENEYGDCNKGNGTSRSRLPTLRQILSVFKWIN